MYVYTLVRFLALVTTMASKVDHGNHHGNHRSDHSSNHCSNHDGYYEHYYDGYHDKPWLPS